MVKLVFKRKIIFLLIFYMIQLITKIMSICEKNKPILLMNGTCASTYCSSQQFSLNLCSIDNEIIKTQWLNNIIILKEEKLKYFDFILSPDGDFLFYSHPSPSNNKRIFYGLKKNGRYYFKDENNNEEIPIFNLTTDINKGNKADSFNSFFIANNGKKLILSLSNQDSYSEVFDLDGKKIYSKTTNNLFNCISFNIRSNLIFLEGSENTFIYSYLGDINNFSAFLIKFQLNINCDNNDFSIIEKKKATNNPIAGEMISSFQTKQNRIICFYIKKNENNNYHIAVYDNNLSYLNQENIIYDQINISFFFSCIYYEGEAGAFIYYKYSGTNIFPYIFFKQYTTKIEDYFTKNNDLILDKYKFNPNTMLNDFIKVSDKKLAYISVSEDLNIIYIVLLIIFSSEQIKIKYFSINAYELYNYKIYQDIKELFIIIILFLDPIFVQKEIVIMKMELENILLLL